ncbi:MAG: hypothetical protein ACKODM_04070, partial [Cytophagales bacterium]
LSYCKIWVYGNVVVRVLSYRLNMIHKKKRPQTIPRWRKGKMHFTSIPAARDASRASTTRCSTLELVTIERLPGILDVQEFYRETCQSSVKTQFDFEGLWSISAAHFM